MKKKVKKLKPKYKTVGVKFLQGTQLWKVYTYRIRRDFKLYLGQELVAPTEYGNRIVVVVDIHTTLQDNGPFNYKTITQKVAPL